MTLFHQQLGQSGPVVIGLHGLATANRLLSLRLSGLAEHARVFCPDLLGHGKSPWPDCAYGLRDHLDALHEWRHAVGLASEPVYLLGVSLGAILVLHYAVREREWYGSDTVRGVVAVSTPAFPDLATGRSVIARTSWIAYLMVHRPAVAERICHFCCGVGGRGWTHAPRLARWLPADIVQDTFAHSWQSLFGTFELVLNPRIPEALARLSDTSVVFVHGDRDRLAPLRFLRDTLDGQRRPNVRLQVLPGVDHDPIVTRTTVVVDAVRDLIRHGSEAAFARPPGGPRLDDS